MASVSPDKMLIAREFRVNVPNRKIASSMFENSQRVRFGDYEADLHTGTLRNRGVRIRLQAQPFRILELLIKNAGELVSREEIRNALWATDTHVGFEIGLNRAVNRLRTALNDSAASPKYIETIPGRGYRFLADVETISTQSSQKPIALGVLPFQNLTDDPALDYLCDGLTEDLNYELARAQGLRLTSPSTMFRYRDVPAVQAAEELNLDCAVRCEVMRRAEKFAIRAELLERRSKAMIWGTRIESTSDGLQNAKSELVAGICEALGRNRPPIAAKRSSSPEAYRSYLQGRYQWNRRTPESMRSAIEYFQRSIETDPEYAQAHSGLADAYALMAISPYCVVPPRHSMTRARAAAERAIAIDPASAEGHTSLALVQFNFDWDFAAAESSFQRAITLNSSYAAAHQWYSLLLIAQSRFEDARRQAAIARELDPMSSTANALVGVSLYFGRKPKEALEELRALVEVEPKSSLAWSFLGMCSIGLKDFDRAEMSFQKALEISPENTTAWAGLGFVWARRGEQDRVQMIVGRIEQLEKERYIPPQVRVYLYIGQGDFNKALDWLDRAYEERCDFLVYLDVDPAFDPLRGLERFESLRLRIKRFFQA